MGFWCRFRKAQYLKKKKSFYQRPPLSSIKFRGKYLSTAFWQLFAYSYPLFCQSLHIGCRNKIYRQFVFKFRTVHAYNKMKGCLRENLNLWNRLIHSQEKNENNLQSSECHILIWDIYGEYQYMENNLQVPGFILKHCYFENLLRCFSQTLKIMINLCWRMGNN